MTARINLQGQYERTPMATATRDLVCAFAACDIDHTLPRIDADWDQVFAAVCNHVLIGPTFYYLNHHTDPDYPPPAFRQQIQAAYRTQVIRLERLYRQIGNVLHQLNRAGIEYLVIKGPALAPLVYPDPMLRSFNDLDLIVRERCWHAVSRVLSQQGFAIDPDSPPTPPAKILPQFSTYETKYWNRQTNFLVEVHYDDLYNTGLIAREVDAFWQRAISLKLGETNFHVPALEDQLIHACMHVHYHGYTRLNWLTDLALLVRRFNDQLDWDHIIQTARREEIQVGVYYTLYFLERLLGIAAPRAALTALRPDRFRRWWHEYYLHEHQVLSLQPMLRPIFSFYFLPVYGRLFPDLLIDGRRAEKLWYLCRLILPPRAWLRDYYKLSDSDHLLVHYFLHPFKLAYHFLNETWRKFRRAKRLAPGK